MRWAADAAALALVFSIPWEATVFVPGIGTASRAIGIVAAGVWLLYAAGTGRLKKPDLFHWAALLFFGWSGLTIFWSDDPAASYEGLITYLQIFVMILIFWDLFDTPARIRAAMQAFVLGAYVSVASTVWNFVQGTSLEAYLRFGPLGFNANDIALVFALAVPLAWYLAAGPTSARSPRWLRVVNFLYVPGAALGMVLSGTRGAIVASIPTAILIVWSLQRLPPAKRLAAYALVAVACVAVVAAAPEASVDRVATVVDEITSGGDLTGRRQIWEDSIDLYAAQPVAGIGLDALPAALASGKVAHNTFLSVLVETGAIGFVLFGATLLLAIRRRHRHVWDRVLWRVTLSVLGIGVLTLSWENQKAGWLVLGLAVSYAALATRPGDDPPQGRAITDSRRGVLDVPESQIAPALRR